MLTYFTPQKATELRREGGETSYKARLSLTDNAIRELLFRLHFK
jgi:hypothetical protein